MFWIGYALFIAACAGGAFWVLTPAVAQEIRDITRTLDNAHDIWGDDE